MRRGDGVYVGAEEGEIHHDVKELGGDIRVMLGGQCL